jgi:hypothetical protein
MRKDRSGTGPAVCLLVIGTLIACPGWLLRPGVASAQQRPDPEVLTALQLAGNYRLPNGTVVGINAFSADGGPPVPLFTDYTSGVDEYSRAQVVAAQQKWWSAYFGAWKGFQSAEDLRWQWEHVIGLTPGRRCSG